MYEYRFSLELDYHSGLFDLLISIICSCTNLGGLRCRSKKKKKTITKKDINLIDKNKSHNHLADDLDCLQYYHRMALRNPKNASSDDHDMIETQTQKGHH